MADKAKLITTTPVLTALLKCADTILILMAVESAKVPAKTHTPFNRMLCLNTQDLLMVMAASKPCTGNSNNKHNCFNKSTKAKTASA